MKTVASRTLDLEHGIQDTHRALIERISGSELFQKSPRLREFLTYSAECTLAHRLADAREQIIAERVFGRVGEFQSGQDSIVRAEARNLRKRLEIYFAGEGAHEPIVVTMPKGGYSLAFLTRQELDQANEPAQALGEIAEGALATRNAEPPIEMPRSGLVREAALYRNLCLVLSGVAACALGAAFYFYLLSGASISGGNGAATTLPFSALLNKTGQTAIVTSDTGFLQISFAAHRRLTLDEYMARNYPSVPSFQPANLIQDWNIFEFTDAREVEVASQIMREYPQFAAHLSMLSGHEVQLQDFKNRNAVLIGSPISNPWAQLYEDKLSFHCVLDASGIVFLNKDKHRGENPKFPGAEDGGHNYTYARVAFLPRIGDTGAVLLLAGTTAQATQSAGEFVLDRGRLGQTLRAMGIDPKGSPKYFELMLRCSNFVSGAILPEVIAWRTALPGNNVRSPR